MMCGSNKEKKVIQIDNVPRWNPSWQLEVFTKDVIPGSAPWRHRRVWYFRNKSDAHEYIHRRGFKGYRLRKIVHKGRIHRSYALDDIAASAGIRK